MPYPSKPRSPNNDETTVGASKTVKAAPPAQLVPMPQAVGGAPRVFQGTTTIPDVLPGGLEGTGVTGADVGTKIRDYDYNVPLTPMSTTRPGPEYWDEPRRNVFVGTQGERVPVVAPHPFRATEILRDYPQAVDTLRTRLLEKRSKLPDAAITHSAFWRRFDELGSAFVAQLIGDVMGLLQQARLQGETRKLSDTQREWIDQHPLSRWMNWQ